MHGIVTTIQYITASARASPAKQKPLGCILAKFSHGDASWKMHKMLFKVPKSCWARQSEEGRSRWLSTLLAFALDSPLGERHPLRRKARRVRLYFLEMATILEVLQYSIAFSQVVATTTSSSSLLNLGSCVITARPYSPGPLLTAGPSKAMQAAKWFLPRQQQYGENDEARGKAQCIHLRCERASHVF